MLTPEQRAEWDGWVTDWRNWRGWAGPLDNAWIEDMAGTVATVLAVDQHMQETDAVLTAARTWAAAHQAMEPDEPLTIEEARARLRAEYQARVALVAAVEALGKGAT